MCLFQLNCKKEDYYTPKPNATEKFFTVPSGTNAQVLRVMDEIKKRNNRKEFVTQFAASNGYPVWNKVLMGTSQKQYANASLSGNNLDGVTDTTILIPFVMEGEFSVKGFIRATLNDSVSLSYSLAKDYKVYEEKLDNSKTASSAFAMLSMVLNKMVFNEDYYKITNPKLFSTDTLHDKTSKIKITAFNFSITDSAGFKQTTICVEHSTILTHCGTPDNAACIPVCDAPFCPGGQCWQVEISQTACYTAGLPDIGGTGGGGDNGGGGEIPYVYPCQGTQNNPSPFTATNNVVDTSDCPVPGEGDGWIPLEDGTEFDYFLGTLTPAQSAFWGNAVNAQFVQLFSNYLVDNGFSTEAKDFTRWAIDFLIHNPGTTIEQFQNWFMSVSEGPDGDYDAAYWENPNTTFPPQNLPSWISFNSAYPKHFDPLYDTPEEMYINIGGQLITLYNSDPIKYHNTCALRVSKAFNYSGVSIPAGIDRYQGADGKYYFVSCKALLTWMKKTFGTPNGSNYLTGSQGGTNGKDFPSLLSNKKGIYIMVPNYPGGCANNTGFCASGHADMIENGVCDGGCYFNATGGVHEIFIWELL